MATPQPQLQTQPQPPQLQSQPQTPSQMPSQSQAPPQDVPQVLMSSMPLPPLHYVNFYTDENIRRNRAPRPPPPPAPEVYTTFGIPYNTDDMIRSLESQNIKRLIPIHYDRRKELKKLNHSLLVNFLDLIDVLILNPESSKRVEKVEDLNLLFVHIHHLANEFRPHQARETIRVMMEVQKRLRVETYERFERHLELMRICANNAFKSVERPEILDEGEFEDLNKPEPEAPPKFVDFMTHEDNSLCDQLDSLLVS